MNKGRLLAERLAILGENSLNVLFIMLDQTNGTGIWNDSTVNNEDLQNKTRYTYSGLQRHKVKLRNLSFLMPTNERRKYEIDELFEQLINE